MFAAILVILQLFLTTVMGIYFYRQVKAQNSQPGGNRYSGRRELDKLNKMKQIHLSDPLNERVRPMHFEDIVGQEQGIQALKAILCGPNPSM